MHEYDSTFEYVKHNKKSATLIFFFLIIVTLSISLYIKCNEEPVIKYKTKKVVEECKKPESKKLIVDIKGYVKKPGVYEVEEETRISDVIELAGGLLLSANTRYLNLSKKVTDELVIIIYSDTEIEEMIEKGEIEEKLPDVKDENLITSEEVLEEETNENKVSGKIKSVYASGKYKYFWVEFPKPFPINPPLFIAINPLQTWYPVFSVYLWQGSL